MYKEATYRPDSHETLSEHVRRILCEKNMLEVFSNIRSTLCERDLPKLSKYIGSCVAESFAEKSSADLEPSAFNDNFVTASDATQTKHLRHVLFRTLLRIQCVFLQYFQFRTIRIAENHNSRYIKNVCGVSVFGAR